jgi:membrane protease YdiL (CAAX protease family)
MSGRAVWDGLASAFRGEQFKPTVILAVSPFLMVAWRYFGDPKWLAGAIPDACVLFSDGLSSNEARQASGAVYSFLIGFALLGLLPALIVRFAFRERLSDFGVRIGNKSRTWRAILVLCPCFVLAGYLAAGDPAVRGHYPINPSAGKSPAMFAIHAATYLLFYIGWEFQFRGFLQVGIRDRIGEVNALLVQVLASGLLHIGRPASETFASLLAGLLWGVLVIRTRSLLPGLLQHCLLGISLDWFLVAPLECGD